FQKDVESFSVDSVPVVLRKTDAFGDIVAMNISAPGGVLASTKAGVLDLMAQVMAMGTESYSKERIDELFAEKGVHFSVDPRNDYLEVNIKCLKKFLPDVLPVVSEMLTRAKYEKK